MAFRNYMEEATIFELPGVLNEINNSCKCFRCREDIIAFALNRLPARYVVRELGAVYTQFEQLRIQARTDIVVELAKAVKVIMENPRH